MLLTAGEYCFDEDGGTLYVNVSTPEQINWINWLYNAGLKITNNFLITLVEILYTSNTANGVVAPTLVVNVSGSVWSLEAAWTITGNPDHGNFSIFNASIIGIDGAAALPQTFKLGNVLTVDDINGDDVTAVPGELPYKTIGAAILAATVGTTIWILPGTYVLATGITLPTGISMRGMSVQTTTISLVGTTSPNTTTLITMGEFTRLEDLTLNLSSTADVNLTGIEFPGSTTTTAKVRSCVLSVTNKATADNVAVNIFGVNASGSGGLTSSSFSFNSIKGSTINVYATGGGDKRGILVSGSNTISTRDVNIFVDKPVSGTSIGSYVGVETNDPLEDGSIQLRSTTIGIVRPTVVELYTASDILQTTPTTIADPTYLVSPGIQIGPGTDLVSKSAGGKGFSTYIYPTTIYYGVLGGIASRKVGYLWPGTILFSTSYPDTTTPVARYKVQQPLILSGISATCNLLDSPHTVIITVCKNASTGASLSNPTSFTVTLTNAATSAAFYNASVDFAAGDYINVHIDSSGTGNNQLQDLAIQLDLF